MYLVANVNDFLKLFNLHYFETCDSSNEWLNTSINIFKEIYYIHNTF